MPTNATSGKGRKKSLAKIYNFIPEPSAPNSGLNYIINSIKGNTNAQQTMPTTTLSNNISHLPKNSLSSKISNPLSITGNTSSNVKANRHTNSSLGKYFIFNNYLLLLSMSHIYFNII